MEQSPSDILLELAAEVFEQPVDPADTLFDLGADSLSVVELSLALEQRLGSPVDVGWLMSGGNLGQLAKELDAMVGTIEVG
jgi:acyl carrier protein